jgi:hypothetical protein
MNRIKFLLSILALGFCMLAQAQIFINTGNPNVEKYRNENPNATIWDRNRGASMRSGSIAKSKTETGSKPQTPFGNSVKNLEPVRKEMPASANDVVPADYPPNALPGKCYARCMVPDQYEIKEEQVFESPEITPLDRSTAQFETVNDTIILKEAYMKTVTIPAQYETVVEDKLISPATQQWVKAPADKNCLSPDPKDCEVWYLKEVPAVYQKVSRKIEKAPATIGEVEVPAEIMLFPRKQLVGAGTVDKTTGLRTIKKKVLVKKGFLEWKEVLCESQITPTKIVAIQEALRGEGYEAGSDSNILSSKTRQALLKFQQDKALPAGNLNIETLKALGITE